ncbi:hypothetical protein Hdeb2414_s0007g00234201 [Helianthus debilis subsp. tardiflorus]
MTRREGESDVFVDLTREPSIVPSYSLPETDLPSADLPKSVTGGRETANTDEKKITQVCADLDIICRVTQHQGFA